MKERERERTRQGEKEGVEVKRGQTDIEMDRGRNGGMGDARRSVKEKEQEEGDF